MSLSSDIPLFKIALLGDSGVGKTSILERFISDAYDCSTDTTVGSSFFMKEITTKKGIISLNIWDTAGQERYRSLISGYTRNCHAILLCFSMDSVRSFENLEKWLELLEKQGSKQCRIYICGNKSDLDTMIPKEAIAEWTLTNGYPFYLTSAKNGTGIKELFNDVAEDLSESIVPIVFAAPVPAIKEGENKCC